MNNLSLNGWPPPFSYIDRPILHMVNPSLDFKRKNFGGSMYIGAQIDSNRFDQVEESVIREIQKVLTNNEGKKTIYCSLSSMDSSSLDHPQKLISVLGNNPSWQMIISLGNKSRLQDQYELPENVHAFDWVPQMMVLEKADVSINHGGIHTIHECKHFEVPMLVYSGEKHDQNGCTARVHFHKIGIMGNKRKDTPSQMEHYLQRLIQDPTFKTNLGHQRKQQEDDRVKGLEKIERLLA